MRAVDGGGQAPGAAERRSSGLPESARRSPRKEDRRRGDDRLAMGGGAESNARAAPCLRRAAVRARLVCLGRGERLAGCRAGLPASRARPRAAAVLITSVVGRGPSRALRLKRGSYETSPLN